MVSHRTAHDTSTAHHHTALGGKCLGLSSIGGLAAVPSDSLSTVPIGIELLSERDPGLRIVLPSHTLCRAGQLAETTLANSCMRGELALVW